MYTALMGYGYGGYGYGYDPRLYGFNGFNRFNSFTTFNGGFNGFNGGFVGFNNPCERRAARLGFGPDVADYLCYN